MTPKITDHTKVGSEFLIPYTDLPRSYQDLDSKYFSVVFLIETFFKTSKQIQKWMDGWMDVT